MPKRNVNLTTDFDRLIEGLVSSGRYENASEVIQAGLRLLERELREDEDTLAVLRVVTTQAFRDLDRGDAVTLDGDAQLAEFVGAIGQRVTRADGSRPDRH